MKCIIKDCNKNTSVWFLLTNSSFNLFCKEHGNIYNNEMSQNDKKIDDFVSNIELDVIKKINVDKEKLKVILDKSGIEVNKVYYDYVNTSTEPTIENTSQQEQQPDESQYKNVLHDE